MSLFKSITVNPTTKVLIWKIEEPEHNLKEGIILTPNCLNRLQGMKSEIHRRGFLSVRQLLREAGYKTSDLYYDTCGKPHLKDGKQISITHSFQYSGLIISDTIKVGIDIEKQRSKIAVIAHKFVNYEFGYLTTEMVRELTVVWCIKESLYKVFATEGMSFKLHSKVIPFTMEEGKTLAWIIYKGQLQKYKTWFIEFDGFTCAYALEN